MCVEGAGRTGKAGAVWPGADPGSASRPPRGAAHRPAAASVSSVVSWMIVCTLPVGVRICLFLSFLFCSSLELLTLILTPAGT